MRLPIATDMIISEEQARLAARYRRNPRRIDDMSRIRDVSPELMRRVALAVDGDSGNRGRNGSGGQQRSWARGRPGARAIAEKIIVQTISRRTALAGTRIGWRESAAQARIIDVVDVLARTGEGSL